MKEIEFEVKKYEKKDKKVKKFAEKEKQDVVCMVEKEE